MNRTQAEDYIYKSYLKAEKFLSYGDSDALKRHPEYTADILSSFGGTSCTIVTGSKGKGSVANMVSCILRTEYSVGLMTSPHIRDFCERFQVDGENISDEEFISSVERLQTYFDKVDATIPKDHFISPIGIQAALALSYFKSRKTDFNVIECGKGARFDDVAGVPHDYAIINSIFLEHTRELGKTLEEIAFDKAHVITGGQKCVYVGEQSPEVLAVIENRAEAMGVPLKRYGHEFEAININFAPRGMCFDVVIGERVFRDISLPLLGEHQAKNCALALALCLDVLTRFDDNKIKESLQRLRWPGRMEILSADPFVLLDACINRESAENVCRTLEYLKIGELIAIIGIPDDKDYMGVVEIMHRKGAEIILTKSQNPHYIFSPNQVKCLNNEGIPAIWTSSLNQAYLLAKQKEKPIAILGTTSLISEAEELFSV